MTEQHWLVNPELISRLEEQVDDARRDHLLAENALRQLRTGLLDLIGRSAGGLGPINVNDLYPLLRGSYPDYAAQDVKP